MRSSSPRARARRWLSPSTPAFAGRTVEVSGITAPALCARRRLSAASAGHSQAPFGQTVNMYPTSTDFEIEPPATPRLRDGRTMAVIRKSCPFCRHFGSRGRWRRSHALDRKRRIRSVAKLIVRDQALAVNNIDIRPQLRALRLTSPGTGGLTAGPP